jgi:hypothetical protein
VNPVAAWHPDHHELILSGSELAELWNKQADEFNQWESLGLDEQLAWAQERAISACHRAGLPP